MLIDFQSISKKVMDRVMNKYNIENDPFYGEKFTKFIKFMGYTFFPKVMNIASFLVLLFIFNKIATSQGIEKLVVLFMAIYVMSMRLGSQKEEKD